MEFLQANYCLWTIPSALDLKVIDSDIMSTERYRKLLLSKQRLPLFAGQTRRLLRPVLFVNYSLNSHMFALFINNNEAIVKAIGRHPS